MNSQTIFNHIVLFGLDSKTERITLSKIQNNQLSVKILHCHPTDREVPVYLSSLDNWCFPDGLKIYDQNIKSMNDVSPEFSFSTSALDQMNDKVTRPDEINKYDLLYQFILTDGQFRRYCSCLTFHQKMFVEDDVKTQRKEKYSKALPKCSVRKIAVNPLKLDFDSALVYVPKCLLVVSNNPFFELHKDFLGHLYKSIILKKVTNSKSGELVISGDDYQDFKQLYLSYGLNKAEEIFDNEYVQLKKKVRRRSQQRAPILVKETTLLQYYISLSTIFDNPSKLKIVQLHNEKDDVLFHYVTQYECFHPPNINILSIFRKLSLQTILKIYKSLILQRQILVFSKRPQLIIEVFESIFYLMKPYVWQNSYIPFLPLHMEKIIDMIGGYVIGMSSLHTDYILENYNLNGKVIILLDDQVVLEQQKEECNYPEAAYQWVTSELVKMQLNKADPKNQRVQIRQKKWLKQVVKIKQCFFNFLLALLNNYRPFLREVDLGIRDFEVETEEFMKIVPQQSKKMTLQLTKTMMFLRMCQRTVHTKNVLEWNQTEEASLFTYCQSIVEQQIKSTQYWDLFGKHRKCLESVIAYQDFIVNRNQRIFEKKQTYLNHQYLIKYIRFLENKGFQTVTNRKKQQTQSSWWHSLSQPNQLYFVNLQEKKNNWTFLNKRNSVVIDEQRLVDIRHIFPHNNLSRYMDFEDDLKPRKSKEFKCYSHKEHQTSNHSD